MPLVTIDSPLPKWIRNKIVITGSKGVQTCDTNRALIIVYVGVSVDR